MLFKKIEISIFLIFFNLIIVTPQSANHEIEGLSDTIKARFGNGLSLIAIFKKR